MSIISTEGGTHSSEVQLVHQLELFLDPNVYGLGWCMAILHPFITIRVRTKTCRFLSLLSSHLNDVDRFDSVIQCYWQAVMFED